MNILHRLRVRLRRLTRSYEAWNELCWPVFYRPEFDGGGTVLARHFIDFLQSHRTVVGPREPAPGFGKVFEWCAGPGFIGFSLLAAGLCEELCLADINPRAIRCVARTVAVNGLGERVRFYVSDNFHSIPASEKFDLIVANPPNYHSLNPAHPLYSRYKDDVRPNDRQWSIHRDFYASVSPYLRDGASLVISEIDPSKAEVRLPGWDIPYDIRPRPALADFCEMIVAGGLTYRGTWPLCTAPGGLQAVAVVSSKQRPREPMPS